MAKYKFPAIFVSLTGHRGTLKRRNMKLGPLLAILFCMLVVELALAGSLLQQFYHSKKFSTPAYASPSTSTSTFTSTATATSTPPPPPPPPPTFTTASTTHPPKNFYSRDYELIRHSLVSGVVGLGADCVAGLQLMLTWTPESLITDSAVTFVDLAFSFNTLGHASEEINKYGRNKGYRNQDRRMRTLQACVVITTILKLVKLLMIHTPLFGDLYE